MKKIFNDTGVCIPEKHYMVDISAKLAAIFRLVEQGNYFVINRPRQYGKTTTLFLLAKLLAEKCEYVPLKISFETISAESYQHQKGFLAEFFLILKKFFRFNRLPEFLEFIEASPQPETLGQLDRFITDLCLKFPKKLILMIDEVDKSSNNQLFLDFLAILRAKYLLSREGQDVTFHSVILAGVHDVKSLKLKIRPDEERKYNSPWNIAVDFTVDMSFNPQEIQTMLRQYSEETGVAMNHEQIAESLYYYTSGYPFFVSKLCKIIDEELKPSQGESWSPEDVEAAVQRVLMIQTTNFDSLIKNLENHSELYKVVEQIVLMGEPVTYNLYNPVVNMGMLYGIFRREDGLTVIHNRIYREQIYNYMAANQEIRNLIDADLGSYTWQEQYLLPDGGLHLEKVLLKFQEFMKNEYSQRDQKFLERNGRLIFLAFLRPIINSKGYDFKEPQISEEKRLDIVVVFERQKAVIELKIWRGEEQHQKGLTQLHDYLDRSGLDRGYLVIFDFTQKGKKAWKQEHIQVEDKNIFAVRV